MTNMSSKWMMALAVLTLGVTSCKEDYFDMARYNKIVESTFPVKGVDKNHDWSVTSSAKVSVAVNGDYDEDHTVKVYLTNPLEDDFVVVLGEGKVKSGEVFSSEITFPKVDDMLYVASIDSKGYRYLKPAAVQDGKLEASFGATSVNAARATRTTTNDLVNIPSLAAPTAYAAEILAKSVEVNQNNNGWNGNNYHYVVDQVEYPDWNNWQAVVVGRSISYNQDYVINYKISTEFTGTVAHLGTAGLQATGRIIEGGQYANTTGYSAECDTVARTVYVDNGGKWTIQAWETQVCGQGIKPGLVDGVIIIGNGGELVVDGTLNMVNAARLIVLPGGKISGNGTINVTNGTNPGEEGYNGGEISVANFNQNYGIFFNYGTITSQTLRGGAGGSTFVNQGKVHVSKVEPNGSQTANLQIKNNCWFEVDNDLAAKIIENAASAYIKSGTLHTSIGEGGEGLGSYIALDNNSMIHVDGDVYLNFTSIIGPVTGDFAMVEFGKVVQCNYDQSAGTSNAGKIINNLYVYVEDLEGSVVNFKAYAFNQQGISEMYRDGNGNAELIDYRKVNVAPTEASSCSPGFTPAEPTPQEEMEEKEDAIGYRFCFEDNFPEPGDYDFNDVVLTVTPVIDANDSRVVNLTVSIDAVGAIKQNAAALRFNNIDYYELESVECTSGDWFDLNSNMRGSYNIDIFNTYLGVSSNNKVSTTLLMNSYAVIPLFNDAHLAINPDGYQPSGLVDRVFYNTADPNAENVFGVEVAPRSITLRLTFNSADVAQRVTGANLDAFIIEPYNSGYWEVHTFPYKTRQVFTQIFDSTKNQQLEENGFPWGIMVPEKNFLYPLEYVSIGLYDYYSIGGAYCSFGHSFAEWAQDRNTAQDWYNYPTSEYVYHPSSQR